MFEKSTWIRLPRTVLVGHDVLDSTVEALSDPALNGRPLVVTGPIPREVAGQRVLDELEAGGLDPAVVEPEGTSFGAVETTIEAARDADAGYLVAVGGGRPIDIAKMAADEIGVGFVSVPTAPSHDGIVSGRASMPDGDTRHSVAADPPLAVIADTGVLADAPWRLTTAGCADIISNYTAVRDWELARRLRNEPYSEYAGALSRMTAEMLVENADSIKQGLEESAWIVLKALISSGVAMSIAGSSRPASGAEHLFSHQLDRLADDPALHGHQVGVGTIAVAYLHSGENGFWREIRSALTAIDAPTTAAELGIDPETATEALATAHQIRDRYTILGDGLSQDAAHEALSITGVIDG
ncbi:MAG: NAD(P)-dependent glycerol-1-phosphate dehydrogenase [Halococcoides sp.]